MRRFEVWAPEARAAAVQAGAGTYAMRGPDDRGWWRVEVEDAARVQVGVEQLAAVRERRDSVAGGARDQFADFVLALAAERITAS